jgi:hypothetical protein
MQSEKTNGHDLDGPGLITDGLHADRLYLSIELDYQVNPQG